MWFLITAAKAVPSDEEPSSDMQKTILTVVAVTVGLAVSVAVGGAIAYFTYNPAPAVETAEAADGDVSQPPSDDQCK